MSQSVDVNSPLCMQNQPQRIYNNLRIINGTGTNLHTFSVIPINSRFLQLLNTQNHFVISLNNEYNQHNSSILTPITANTIDSTNNVNVLSQKQKQNMFHPSNNISKTSMNTKATVISDNKSIALINNKINHSPLFVRSPKTKKITKNNKCSICGKSFQHQDNLEIHQIIHTNAALACKFCDKKFARNNNLAQHIKVHTNYRPWKCKQCNKAFKQKKCLVDHERTHSGERPYKCEYCERAFAVKHNLTSHRRLHTGQRPYQCSLCIRKFISKSSLNGHTKRKHSDLWNKTH